MIKLKFRIVLPKKYWKMIVIFLSGKDPFYKPDVFTWMLFNYSTQLVRANIYIMLNSLILKYYIFSCMLICKREIGIETDPHIFSEFGQSCLLGETDM